MTNRSSQASGPSPGCIDHLRYLFPTMNNPIFLLSPELSSSMPSRIPPRSYPYLEMSQHLCIQPPRAQQIVFSEDGLTNVFIHPTCSSYKTGLTCLPLRRGVSVTSLGVWTRQLPRSVEKAEWGCVTSGTRSQNVYSFSITFLFLSLSPSLPPPLFLPFSQYLPSESTHYFFRKPRPPEEVTCRCSSPQPHSPKNPAAPGSISGLMCEWMRWFWYLTFQNSSSGPKR